MRSALAPFYWLQKRLWRVFRPRTRGVKVMLFNPAGEVLLIRNRYGQSNLFLLPGGNVGPFETPEDAAVREVREELGCSVARLVLVSRHFNQAESKRDTIFLFEGMLDGPFAPDGIEVAEARFFAIGDLPDAASPATRRRIEERLGRRAPDGTW